MYSLDNGILTFKSDLLEIRANIIPSDIQFHTVIIPKNIKKIAAFAFKNRNIKNVLFVNGM